jgi:hypothetical protein
MDATLCLILLVSVLYIIIDLLRGLHGLLPFVSKKPDTRASVAFIPVSKGKITDHIPVNGASPKQR